MDLCLLESNGCSLPISLKRVLAKLCSSLKTNNRLLALKWVEIALQIIVSQGNVPAGPILLAGAEFHGFVRGCSPASILVSLRVSGWPRITLWEHDIKSAFESCDLDVIVSNHPLRSRLPRVLSLVGSIMSSDLIVRSALLSDKIFSHPDFVAASIKQFPGIQPGIRNFTTNELIQGSPISPILFILYIAALSFGEIPSGGIKRSLWVYGDNVYSVSSLPPCWNNCQWKPPVRLGTRGKTLGLEYHLDDAGRLVVSHSNEAYSLGVQRKLDQQLATVVKGSGV